MSGNVIGVVPANDGQYVEVSFDAANERGPYLRITLHTYGNHHAGVWLDPDQLHAFAQLVAEIAAKVATAKGATP